MATDLSTLQSNLSAAKDERKAAVDAGIAADKAVTAAEQALSKATASGDAAAIALAQAQYDTAAATLDTVSQAVTTSSNKVDEIQSQIDALTKTNVDSNGTPTVNPPETPADPGTIDSTARQTGATASANTAPGGSAASPSSGSNSLPVGGVKTAPSAATAQWAGAKDLRVKLRVPSQFITGPAEGPPSPKVGIIKQNGGILFPYTPQISMTNQANYATNTPLHSNYPLYFFKNGTVGPIQVTAKFTVQNEYEGAVLLGIIHLLRSLTKMKFGNDPDAGSPPPVCRLDAYGDYMFYNVPVAVASWRHDLPDNVDYITVGRTSKLYGTSMVPVLSTITLDLNIMYSRQEMLAYNTKQWLAGDLKFKGYL
jgi:hypothetical protein